MGLEVVISLLGTLLTTVFIARIIGPTRLGYFNLVFWLTSITCSVGSLGIPLTTFKYMGEFLGSGQKELARAVFYHSLRAQALISSVLSVAGLVAVFTVVDPPHRIYSVFLVLSIVPNMLTFVPSQANTAAENSALNTRGAFVAGVINVLTVGLSLFLGWDLIGIAAGILLSRSAELVVKIVPVFRSMSTVQHIPIPGDIRKRMYTFSGISTGLMILQIVVWDRSDIIFLKILQSDIRQLTFFSLCFSIADRLMRLPQSFANALSATQMAEFGRDKNNLFKITSQAATYVLMAALPLLVGVACIAGPLVSVAYGDKYLPAIPVLIVVSLFTIPKAMLAPAQTLLYSTEELWFLLKWSLLAGFVNVGFDLGLIPSHGAMGAAWANGLAQSLAAIAIWWRVLVRYPVPLQRTVLTRIVVATLAMALAVVAVVVSPFSASFRLVLAIPTGAIVFLIMTRVLAVLQQEDRRRLLVLGAMVPTGVRPVFNRFINFLAPVRSAG